MMFASKTPRDLNHDPEPWALRHWDGAERPRGWEACQEAPEWYDRENSMDYSPRPEFDHVQHNEPNRLLIAARKVQSDGHLDAFMEGFLSGRNTSHPEIDHAQKVLQRLANLTKEQA